MDQPAFVDSGLELWSPRLVESIVYQSKTGHTRQYAEMLGELTGLPVFNLGESKRALSRHAKIVYCGWLFGGEVKGFMKASRRYDIVGVVACCMGKTGSQIPVIRRKMEFCDAFPLFTVQGGLEQEKLRGVYKRMIYETIKVAQQDVTVGGHSLRTADDRKAISIVLDSANYGNLVNERHLDDVVRWLKSL